MSWETLVTGTFYFKEKVPEDKKEEVLAQLEDTLETDSRWNSSYKEYSFESLNWNSHVEGRGIKEAVERSKEYLEEFECSLYYLSESDEVVILEDGKVTANLC